MSDKPDLDAMRAEAVYTCVGCGLDTRQRVTAVRVCPVCRCALTTPDEYREVCCEDEEDSNG